MAMKRHLRLDPIACTGHGLCADFYPEGIKLDDWGFPILDPRAIPASHLEHAKRAVRACPDLALTIVTTRE